MPPSNFHVLNLSEGGFLGQQTTRGSGEFRRSRQFRGVTKAGWFARKVDFAIMPPRADLTDFQLAGRITNTG